MNDTLLKWDLKKYFYDSFKDPKYIEDKKAISKGVKNFIQQYRGIIKTIETNKEILSFLTSEEKLDETISKVLNFAYMNYYLNSEDEGIQKEIMVLESLTTKLSEDLLFVQEEIKELGENKLLKFSEDPILKDYKNYFYQIAKSLKYQLSNEVEKVLLQTSQSGFSAQLKLYDDLASSYQYPWEDTLLPEEELLVKLEDVDENIRKKAYLILSKEYSKKERRTTHASIYTSVVKNWVTSGKIRGFTSPIQKHNIGEEISDKTVDTLLSTIENSYSLFQKYLTLKAKVLGKKKLEIWDVYAPIGKIKKEFTPTQAINMVLTVLKKFDLNWYEFSKEMIECGRVDFMPKKGKSQGAFALYGKKQSSFVLLNYTNSLSDISTLIHELGHAYHGHLSQTQNSHSFDSPLILAETASIFNELLLSEHFKTILSNEEKKEFLFKELDEVFGTIFKQTQYVLFERRIHNGVLEGEEYTQSDYSKIWREESQKLNGNCIKYYEKAEEETSWQRIPHIFRSPFYCYSYAFGNLLTYALYEQYIKDGRNTFLPKYRTILESGGSKTPQDLLKPLGFDLESEEFYMLGINMLQKKLEELKKLI